MKKLPGIYLVTLLLLLSSFSTVSADYLYDRSGTLVIIDGDVLGDDDISDSEVENEQESSDDSNSNSRGREKANEASKKQEEKRREDAKNTLEKQIESRKKIQEKTKTESQLEIRQENDKFKLKQEIKDAKGRVTKKEIELKGGESLHVEEENGERTELRPKQEDSLEDRAAKLEIIKNKIKTETDLPLVVNKDNELILTKKDGTTKVLTILPDQAKAKLVEKGILTEQSGSAPELTTNASGDPVYTVTADEPRKVLGLFKFNFKTKSEVDVETGEVSTEIEEVSPWRQLLFRWSR